MPICDEFLNTERRENRSFCLARTKAAGDNMVFNFWFLQMSLLPGAQQAQPLCECSLPPISCLWSVTPVKVMQYLMPTAKHRTLPSTQFFVQNIGRLIPYFLMTESRLVVICISGKRMAGVTWE
jgi:hypothetical protein